MSVDFALVKKEIHFRARRGLKETDLLFGRFIAAHLDDLSEAQLIELRNLLLEFDQDLLKWFIEKELPETRRTPLTEMLLGFSENLHRYA
jgi:succinate dehydrogenase flavin-adding protein (antitoxin of CptAB toxin-antitoxin module)